jgi:hypothetical protein
MRWDFVGLAPRQSPQAKPPVEKMGKIGEMFIFISESLLCDFSGADFE